ncbi:hypothetical protein ABTX81_30375 [Kitasatospora sp. NPDC097605]|uniref:hypothetical protein n=1 Tax=Kitasatospora sp. NPDC097605 TaxID=3157226 RepID=UPI0033203BD8
MTTDPREYYAIHLPDGRYLHHLPHRLLEGIRPGGTLTLHSDTGQLTRVPGQSDWWAADHPVTGPVTARWTPYPETTSYRIKNPADANTVFPATVTVDEFRDMEDNLGGVVFRMYDPITQDQPEQSQALDAGPWRFLEGEQPPADGDRRWVVDLPASLTNHPEYRWWLPGKLTGLFDAVANHAKSKGVDRFGVGRSTVKFDGVEGHLRVDYAVPFQRPVTHQLTEDWKGKKLRRPETVQTMEKRRIVLPVPDAVHADNYAAALAQWNDECTRWTAAIDAEMGVKACNHCGGHGFIPDGLEQYTPAPASRNETPTP